jgi:hypothetical protein
MVKHTLIALTLCLSTTMTQAADKNEVEEAERWIKDLTKHLVEQGEVSGTYLNNYIQCMQDQHHLHAEPDDDMKKLWQSVMGATEHCAPVIDEMFDALQEEKQPPAQDGSL